MSFLFSFRTIIYFLLFLLVGFLLLTLIIIYIRAFYLHFIKKLPWGKRSKNLSFNDKFNYFNFIKVCSNNFFIDKSDFPFFGTHFFSGSQGSGKTISSIRLVRAIKKAYPECILISNCYIDCADIITSDLNVFIDYKNDNKGVIMYIDEIQNTFNSLTRDFPLDFLAEICQQRKQSKMLVCTSQVFNRVSRPIREQCHFLYKPHTFFNCVTFYISGIPEFDSEFNVKELTDKHFNCFVHTTDLYNSFNTYEKIDKLLNASNKK